jgi:hypothetical protein
MMPLPLSVRRARTCGGSFLLVAAVMATLVARAAEALPPCANCAAEQTLPSADMVPDAPSKSPVPPSDPAVQAQLPGCAEWTDRCVTLPTRRRKDHTLQHRNHLPTSGGGMRACGAGGGEEAGKLTKHLCGRQEPHCLGHCAPKEILLGAGQTLPRRTRRCSIRLSREVELSTRRGWGGVWQCDVTAQVSADAAYATSLPAIGSFNSRAALRQNTASRSRGGRLRSSMSWMARGLREVSGGASLP